MSKDLQKLDRIGEINDVILLKEGSLLCNLDRYFQGKRRTLNFTWGCICLFLCIIFIGNNFLIQEIMDTKIYQQKAEKEAYIARMKAWCDSVANDRNSIAGNAKDTIDFIRAEKGKP